MVDTLASEQDEKVWCIYQLKMEGNVMCFEDGW
jgi:hypothetical protein